MDVSPHLPISVPHVEMLADFLVLLLPIYPLTSPGTVQGGLTLSAVLELELWRCSGATDDAALDHHCCWSGVRVALNVTCDTIVQRMMVAKKIVFDSEMIHDCLRPEKTNRHPCLYLTAAR
jgi:hypothetical protein